MDKSGHLKGVASRFVVFLFAILLSWPGKAQSPYASSEDYAKYALKLREGGLLTASPRVEIMTGQEVPAQDSNDSGWKENIITSVFWIGQAIVSRNPVHNHASSWSRDWEAEYGGYDDPNPSHRRDFVPVTFTPRLNPFYCALPYNDVARGVTKPEARLIIPWFSREFVKEGTSVCKNHWVAIKSPQTGKTCYAQWSDCGPFRTDHWQYVFGGNRPEPNLNGGVGLAISPAVQEFLGANGTDVTDWRFVGESDVPPGPWCRLGENNTFVTEQRASQRHMADAGPDVSVGGDPSGSSSRVR